MKKQKLYTKTALICFVSSLIFLNKAAANEYVTKIVNLNQGLTMQQRILQTSENLIGKPGIPFALGESKTGSYDNRELYDLNEFSCQTFVETVMALSLAKDFKHFLQHLIEIRYQNGKISFVNRNHFPSVQWIRNNIRKGYIIDLTPKIAGKYLKKASLSIDIPNWYKHIPMNRIIPEDFSRINRAIKLQELNAESRNQHAVKASINYLPLNVIFNPKISVLSKIPNAAIVMLVRKNWPDKENIGTKMLVSHMTFAIWNNKKLY